MTTPAEIPLTPVIQNVIDTVSDKNRLAAGMRACETRRSDFASEREMRLAGIAMIPGARELMDEALTTVWEKNTGDIKNSGDYRQREIVIGAGYSAAVYCAIRVRMGFPKPVVLELNGPEQVGGAFAYSLHPVFRLNSRSRPGPVGLPDQDKALNYLPGGLLQPAMIFSEEYPTNADLAWLIRLTLAQYAIVIPGVTVTALSAMLGNSVRVTTNQGVVTPGRVIDARGTGTELATGQADNNRILTFRQYMARMGGMFPLRGVQQVAIVGGGNGGLCAAESVLGIAPGHTSVTGLDYPVRADLYATSIDGRTCDNFRTGSRGRYIRLAQALEGNVSQPTTRLRVISQRGYVTPLPDGALVGDRTYDLAILATGSLLDVLGTDFAYLPVRRSLNGGIERAGVPARGAAAIAAQAVPYPVFRIGAAADIEFSPSEVEAGIAEIPQNKISMFRNGPRIAALAMALPALPAS